jgi:TetR/AcrR family transcriptional regulator, fatty acid metabolism regulator protein
MSKKKAIIAAATRHFSGHGFSDTSMSTLAKAAGVASSTIFHHFENKEALFLTVLQSAKEAIVQNLSQEIARRPCRDGLSLVGETISAYLHVVGVLEDEFRLLQRHFPYELARHNPRCQMLLEAIYTELLDRFEAGILKGQADGSIRRVPSRNLALILFSTVDGMVRFHTYQLYDAGALYQDLMRSCHQLLAAGEVGA